MTAKQYNEKTIYKIGFFSYAESESDKMTNCFLLGYFTLGLLLSFFYNTWAIALYSGGLCLFAYYSAKIILPKSNFYQYVLSVVLGIFVAQYIYQMHGLLEMNLLAIIGSAALVTYQNWKLQIPLAIVLIIHHALFAYLQSHGFDKIYFTQYGQMPEQNIIMRGAFGALAFFICGFWSYRFRKYTERTIEQSYEIGRLGEEKLQREALVKLSEDLRISNEKLNEANYELGMLFNNIKDVLFSIDIKSNRLTNISPASAIVYGYTPAEFYSNPELWKQVIHPEDKHLLKGKFKPLYQGEQLRIQYRIIHKDGSIRCIENHIIPTVGANNEVMRLDGITRDRTEKMKAEAEIINLNASLEQKVLERTEQLEAAVKELEAFSYSVSHDLRAPLRVINGFGKLLMRRYEDKLDKDAMESLQAIVGNAKQMGQLIDDLLDFSRLGKAPVVKNEVDMTEMVKSVVSETMAFEPANISRINLRELQPALCDAALIKQVWVNLVSNAVKYSRKRDNPQIEIGTIGENGHTTYYVKDNGAGFDMEHSDKLFGVFQRLHKVAEYEGTGVGLALVKRIINKHGGKIWAEGKVDQGATFYFTLPH